MTDFPATTRSRRFLGGLSLGYLHTAVVILVGLWLTPYLLRHLGQHDYGLWLLAAQVVLYLGLMDLGVVALLPRDVAYASGLDDERQEKLEALIGQSTRLVLWQTPVVLAGGLLAWWLVPTEWAALQWPLLLVVLAFVATFPFRIFHAVLQGLQDLSFLGSTQLAAWGAGTVVTVLGVALGFGLYSIAAGWIVTQALTPAVSWWRLRTRFPEAVPARLPSLTLAALKAQFGKGVWVSLSQVAQALLNGTDLLVIGKLLGPDVVVPYACTAKLVMLLGNQPQLFMQTALPALSELRASAPRERLVEVSTAMTQLMLLASGGIVVLVLVVNEAFVTWWVGAARYGGLDLTILLVAGMLIRHWNITAVYTLFCFGYERRLALTAMAEGAAALAAMLLLIPLFGMSGGAMATLLSTCIVALPLNLRALVREQDVSLLTFLGPLRSSALRLAIVLAAVVALVSIWDIRGVWAAAGSALAAGAVYALVMWPMLFAPPLGPMVVHHLQPLTPFVPGLSRRLLREQNTP